jgi:hypothetical protein
MENRNWLVCIPNTLFYSNETSVLILYTHSPSLSLVKTKFVALQPVLCDSRNSTTIPDGTEILKGND